MSLALRSTSGCLRCRRRRIKCDESRPVCMKCSKTKLECLWPEQIHVDGQYLRSNTILGNLYANLAVKIDCGNFEHTFTALPVTTCPVKGISCGFPAFRNQQEHQDLVNLAYILGILTLTHHPNPNKDVEFPFSIALQERWVRDALIAFSRLVADKGARDLAWAKILPYYSSASHAVRTYVSQELDETRLEQLLVATVFLGMIEMNNHGNEIFPLLHFEAVGRFLEALHRIQGDRMLSSTTIRFHRIALESYLYHVSIQSLYFPRTDRFTTLSSLLDGDAAITDVDPKKNMIIKLDVKVYIHLFKLARFARLKRLSPHQREAAQKLDEGIRLIEANAVQKLQATSGSEDLKHVNFWNLTCFAATVLLILSEKVLDRSLLSTSPRIRSLAHEALNRLEKSQSPREWTGDFCWTFIILTCATHASDDCERLSRKLRVLSNGFWRSDLSRMKKVLEIVRATRAARLANRTGSVEESRANDTLHLLVEARLSLE